MPLQSSAGPIAEPAVGQSVPLSRRSVLRGAAGVGAVGLAAAGGVTAVAGLTRQDAPAGQDTSAATAAVLGGPVMVYLHDASTGEMEIFAGTGQTSLRNPALVRELLRAIK
jgi:hypothetical protein